MIDSRTLFNDLCARLGVQPDRRGEAHYQCPECGKEVKRGQTHFSFSERGAACMVCGYRASLNKLAARWGHEAPRPMPAPAPRPKPLERRLVTNWALLSSQYAGNPRLLEAWNSYKPLPEHVIRAHRLGLGAFPRYLSKCQHERLMVPLFESGECVGIRGRSTGCECGKWLSPQGSRCTLYNAEHLARARGKVLFIVENPIDALMLEQLSADVVAVATLGVSMWQEPWTEWVAACGAARVIVAYDNDVPGNGGGERGREEWLRTHAKDLVPNGVRLVNRLLKAGAPARLYDWGDAPLKSDIGSVLMGRVA
jgi:DNA-directed RNA polymerase subunit RPC12/RpoP